MTHSFICWFNALHFEPEQVGVAAGLRATLSSNDYDREMFAKPGDVQFWDYGTLISNLLDSLRWGHQDDLCSLSS